MSNVLLNQIKRLQREQDAIIDALQPLAESFMQRHNAIQPIEGYDKLHYIGFNEEGYLYFKGDEWICGDHYEYSFEIECDDLLDDERKESYFETIRNRVVQLETAAKERERKTVLAQIETTKLKLERLENSIK